MALIISSLIFKISMGQPSNPNLYDEINFFQKNPGPYQNWPILE
jgi:hypothetical protein